MEVGAEAVETNPSKGSAAKDQRKMDGGGGCAWKEIRGRGRVNC